MQAAAIPLQTTPPTAAPARRRGLQTFLLILAVFLTVFALLGAMILYGNLSDTPGLRAWTLPAMTVLSPFVAIAAAVFALTGRLRHAIVAIAALGLLDWLNYLPSVVEDKRGVDVLLTYPDTLMQLLVLPTLAVFSIVLAVRNVGLVAAALMAAVSALICKFSILLFAVAVTIYGA